MAGCGNLVAMHKRFACDEIAKSPLTQPKSQIAMTWFFKPPYLTLITTAASCSPSDVAVKVTVPAFSWLWIMANAKPWNALR